jgi:POT family proton-dependent oligopeptide transporter
LIVLCCGYFFLSLAKPSQVLLALGLICVGNGLFKANPANLLSRCYEQNDPRLHGGFTLYYMAVNLGSIFALFAGPALSSHFGYGYAYMMSALGLLLAILNYWYQYPAISTIETEADEYSISFLKWILVLLGIIGTMFICAYLMEYVHFAKTLLAGIIFMVLGFYAFAMKKEEKTVVLQMLLALILMIEAVIFFILYQQMPTSLNLFAVHHVSPLLLGLPIDPQSFQVLNPIWIVLLSTPLAWLYGKCYERDYNFSIVHKFALGMTSSGLSFLLLYFSRYFHNQDFFVSSGWLIASYLLQSLGELLVSALGMAMVAELVPNSIRGFVMGMWFLCTAVAGFLGATVASYTSLPEHLRFGMESLNRYTLVFGWIGLVILGISALMWLSAPMFQRWIKMRA